MASEKYKRVQYWLKKDPDLTTAQLRELTGATDTIIGRVRKELGISSKPCPISFDEMDKAFKKFLHKRGKTLSVRANFNPSFSPRTVK